MKSAMMEVIRKTCFQYVTMSLSGSRIWLRHCIRRGLGSVMLVVTPHEAAEHGCWGVNNSIHDLNSSTAKSRNIKILRSEEGTGIGWPAPFIDFLFHFFHF